MTKYGKGKAWARFLIHIRLTIMSAYSVAILQPANTKVNCIWDVIHFLTENEWKNGFNARQYKFGLYIHNMRQI